MATIDWPADKVERRKVSDLIPYARNSRTHSEDQVKQIAASIKEWGWTTPVLVAEDNTIIAGHGRVMAAQKLKIKDVPCMVATGWSEAQKKAYTIADNKLALNAGWDNEMLKIELEGLQDDDFDIDLIGVDDDFLSELDFSDSGVASGVDDETYSRKVDAPIYEIKGEKPKVSDLADVSRTNSLIEEIEAKKLPKEIKEFLIHAAHRHTVFDFAKIAEFYAHSDEKTQSLMERSALIIIDFEQAIEENYVKLVENLKDQYSIDRALEAEREDILEDA